MLKISDEQRRARIARRHAIAPTHRVDDIVTATRAMTALHATEAATPHLSLLARVRDLTIADVDAALYDDRSVVKVMAMRRTLFVVARDFVPAAIGSAGRRVGDSERKRILNDAVDLTRARGERWIDDAAALVGETLTNQEMSTRELRAAIPDLGGTITAAAGTKWAAQTPVLARLMTMLTADGTVVRGHNGGHWRIARPRFTSMATWLGAPFEPTESQPGYVDLIRSWLHTFGPGTEADIVWWLGSTKSVVRAALAELDAIEVVLDSGSIGRVLAEDLDELTSPVDEQPWVALLPVLDPTTMGWRERDFYLDPAHTPYLFDRRGNGGSTVWINGRIVGCWVQDHDGRVRTVLMEDASRDIRHLLDIEVARLDQLLDREHITNVFASPQMKQQRLG